MKAVARDLWHYMALCVPFGAGLGAVLGSVADAVGVGAAFGAVLGVVLAFLTVRTAVDDERP